MNILFILIGFFAAEAINLIIILLLTMTSGKKKMPTKEEWKQL